MSNCLNCAGCTSKKTDGKKNGGEITQDSRQCPVANNPIAKFKMLTKQAMKHDAGEENIGPAFELNAQNNTINLVQSGLSL